MGTHRRQRHSISSGAICRHHLAIHTAIRLPVGRITVRLHRQHIRLAMHKDHLHQRRSRISRQKMPGKQYRLRGDRNTIQPKRKRNHSPDKRMDKSHHTPRKSRLLPMGAHSIQVGKRRHLQHTSLQRLLGKRRHTRHDTASKRVGAQRRIQQRHQPHHHTTLH